MDVVRILNLDRYDSIKGRFNSVAFKIGGAGFSVIDGDCANERSGTICVHVERYYQRIAGQPFAYWLLDPQALIEELAPEQAYLQSSPSDTGDACHREIVGVNNSQLAAYAQARCKHPSVFLCMPAACINLTGDQFAHLKQYIASLATAAQSAT